MISGYEMDPLLKSVELVSPAYVEQAHEREGLVGTTKLSMLVQMYERQSEYDEPGYLPRLEDVYDVAGTNFLDTTELAFDDLEDNDESFRANANFFDLEDEQINEYRECMGGLFSLRGLAELLEASGGLDGMADLRIGFIQDVLADYRTLYPDATFEASQKGSVRETERFLSFYSAAITEQVDKENWVVKIDGWRQEYVTALDSPKLKSLLPATTRRQMAADAERVPVLVVDPLSSALIGKSWEREIFGMMDPETRTISVDPFSASHVLNRNARNKAERLRKIHPDEPIVPVEQFTHEGSVQKTLFHELIHFSTNNFYHRVVRVDDDVDAPYYSDSTSVADSWPQFWFEGMTEKLAQTMAAEVIDADLLPWDPSLVEERLWRETSVSPRQLGLTKKAQKLSERLGVSYIEYRILIDTMFDRLDWEAAGLKPAEAEKLAFRAFTDRVMPGGESGAYRQQFVRAVNQAAHPGFWMKLQALVANQGPALVIDMLSDPSFDAHKPADTPWLTSEAAVKNAGYYAEGKQARSASERLERLINMGAPLVITDGTRKAYESLVATTNESQILLAARDGLKTVLEQRYMRRAGPSPADRMLGAIFGDKGDNMRMRFVERPSVDTSVSRAAIEAWQASQKSKS